MNSVNFFPPFNNILKIKIKRCGNSDQLFIISRPIAPLPFSLQSTSSFSGFRFSGMGRIFVISLDGNGLFYSCKYCLTHLALADDILSKSFYCRHGSAYLFDKCVNVTLGEKDDRMMITGVHTVVDIFCVGCGAILGWKYETAYDKSQKYKEGKFILERFQVVGPCENNNAMASEGETHVMAAGPALSFSLQTSTIDSDTGTE